MSGRQFGGTAYARGTAPVTTTPLTMMVCGQYGTLATNNTLMHLCDPAGAVSTMFSIRMDSADAGAVRIQCGDAGGSNSTATTNTVAANTPFYIVARFTSATLRDLILDGNIATKATSTTSRTPTGITRVSFGLKDDSGANQPFNGVVFYGAIWNVALSDAEVTALAKAAPPAMIRPSALRSWWPDFGRGDGITVIDRLGRAPLTLSGGSVSSAAARRIRGAAPVVGRKRGTALALTAPQIAPTGSAGLDAQLENAEQLLLESGEALLLETAAGDIIFTPGIAYKVAPPLIAAGTILRTPSLGGATPLTPPMIGSTAAIYAASLNSLMITQPIASATQVRTPVIGRTQINKMRGVFW